MSNTGKCDICGRKDSPLVPCGDHYHFACENCKGLVNRHVNNCLPRMAERWIPVGEGRSHEELTLKEYLEAHKEMTKEEFIHTALCQVCDLLNQNRVTEAHRLTRQALLEYSNAQRACGRPLPIAPDTEEEA